MVDGRLKNSIEMKTNQQFLMAVFLTSGLTHGSVLIDDFETGPINASFDPLYFQTLPSVLGGTRTIQVLGSGPNFSMQITGGILSGSVFGSPGYSIDSVVSWGYTGVSQGQPVGNPNRNFSFPGGMIFRVYGSNLPVGNMNITLRNVNGGLSRTGGVLETPTSVVFNCANPYHITAPFDLNSVDVISLVVGSADYWYSFTSISGGTAQVNLTGILNLADMAATGFSRSISYTLKQGTATLTSGTITATASSSPLAMTVPASATGAAQLSFDGSSFLKRVVNVNLTGSNLSLGTFILQNGDVDNSGEVDAVDIDTVIAAFGSTQNIVEDVDGSGEVDATDIDIIIANFGAVNQ